MTTKIIKRFGPQYYAVINDDTELALTKCAKCKLCFAFCGPMYDFGEVCFSCPFTTKDLTIKRTGRCQNPHSESGYCSCIYKCESDKTYKIILKMKDKCRFCGINTEYLRPVGEIKDDKIKVCCYKCSGLVNDEQLIIINKIQNLRAESKKKKLEFNKAQQNINDEIEKYRDTYHWKTKYPL